MIHVTMSILWWYSEKGLLSTVNESKRYTGFKQHPEDIYMFSPKEEVQQWSTNMLITTGGL